MYIHVWYIFNWALSHSKMMLNPRIVYYLTKKPSGRPEKQPLDCLIRKTKSLPKRHGSSPLCFTAFQNLKVRVCCWWHYTFQTHDIESSSQNSAVSLVPRMRFQGIWRYNASCKGKGGGGAIIDPKLPDGQGIVSGAVEITNSCLLVISTSSQLDGEVIDERTHFCHFPKPI